MEYLLNNPVYHALLSGEAPLSFGTADVKFFDEQVSPFVGFKDGYSNGFEDLYELLPPARRILYASPQWIQEPKGWQVSAAIKGLQFVFDPKMDIAKPSLDLVSLQLDNVEEMIQLANLTKPGPFSKRTIAFGHYYGIFEKGQLVAMTGQRLHVSNYSEISAVCTHPQHLGKGYAAALIQQQLHLICSQQQIPFLHVREDNARAIVLYERLGFKVRSHMNFFFLKKQ